MDMAKIAARIVRASDPHSDVLDALLQKVFYRFDTGSPDDNVMNVGDKSYSVSLGEDGVFTVTESDDGGEGNIPPMAFKIVPV